MSRYKVHLRATVQDMETKVLNPKGKWKLAYHKVGIMNAAMGGAMDVGYEL